MNLLACSIHKWIFSSYLWESCRASHAAMGTKLNKYLGGVKWFHPRVGNTWWVIDTLIVSPPPISLLWHHGNTCLFPFSDGGGVISTYPKLPRLSANHTFQTVNQLRTWLVESIASGVSCCAYCTRTPSYDEVSVFFFFRISLDSYDRHWHEQSIKSLPHLLRYIEISTTPLP